MSTPFSDSPLAAPTALSDSDYDLASPVVDTVSNAVHDVGETLAQLTSPRRAKPRFIMQLVAFTALAGLCGSFGWIAHLSSRQASGDDDWVSLPRSDDTLRTQHDDELQPMQTSAHHSSSPTQNVSSAAPADLQAAAKAAGLDLRTAAVQSTFGETARQLGMDSATAAAVTRAFAGTVDFRRDLHQGDRVAVLLPRTDNTGPGTAARPPLPVAIRIGSGAAAHEVFLYAKLGGAPLYYRKDGHSTKPSFARFPLVFKRISSPFSLHRLDPVTHRWQAHDGVDLAAPMGTPVHATAAGRVTFSGWDGGYGRLVEIQNVPPYSTRFAHLSRFRKGLHVGQNVKRGDVIGYVGRSGWATGPHLHYEVRMNQVAMNPLTVPLPNGHRLAGDDARQFFAQTQALAPLL